VWRERERRFGWAKWVQEKRSKQRELSEGREKKKGNRPKRGKGRKARVGKHPGRGAREGAEGGVHGSDWFGRNLEWMGQFGSRYILIACSLAI
jgi:hypothetical protein